MFKKVFRWPWIAGAAGIVVLAILLVGPFPYLRNYQSATPMKLSLSPDLASPGATIMVSGWGYPANGKVGVYFQNRGNGVVQTKAREDGFFNTALTLPKTYSDGQSYVYAVSDDGYVVKAPFKFIQPTLTFASAYTSLRGSGFSTNEPVSFSLRDGNSIVKLGQGKTDEQGHFSVKLALPALPFSRRATLVVSDSRQQKQVSLAVRLTPQVSLHSVAGAIGAKVVVTGKGFGRKETVSIALQGEKITAVTADNNGSFSTKFAVPSSAKSAPYVDNIHVTGKQSNATALASFQVLPSVTASSETISPGEQIIARGSQFTPSEQAQITLFDANKGVSIVGISLGEIHVSAKGDFTVHLTIPRNIKGSRTYTILLIDESSGLNAPITFKTQ